MARVELKWIPMFIKAYQQAKKRVDASDVFLRSEAEQEVPVTPTPTPVVPAAVKPMKRRKIAHMRSTPAPTRTHKVHVQPKPLPGSVPYRKLLRELQETKQQMRQFAEVNQEIKYLRGRLEELAVQLGAKQQFSDGANGAKEPSADKPS